MSRQLIKTYSELITLPTFEERFEYLKLAQSIGEETFGQYRYLIEQFYWSKDWRQTRNKIIVRDNGCDLGVDDGEHEIPGRIHVHHINPITITDLMNHDPILLDPENLISMWEITHKALTFGNIDLIPKPLVERTKNDTCPWRKG